MISDQFRDFFVSDFKQCIGVPQNLLYILTIPVDFRAFLANTVVEVLSLRSLSRGKAQRAVKERYNGHCALD